MNLPPTSAVPTSASTTAASTRIASLRLPADLPPRDLERLAATSTTPVHPAPASAPASFGLSPSTHSSKFGGEGSPADVRVYAPAVAPLLMRGRVVSPTHHSTTQPLVLPNLSLPLSGPTSAPHPPPPPPLPLPSVSQPRSAPPPDLPHHPVSVHSPVNHNPLSVSHHLHQHDQAQPPPLHVSRALSHRGNTNRGPIVSGPVSSPTSPTAQAQMTQSEIKKAQNRKSAKRFREAQKQRWKNMADDLIIHKRTISELRAQLAEKEGYLARANALLDGREPLRTDERRSAMSINDLVDAEASSSATPATSPVTPPAQHAHMEAEAALYAQILSNTARKPAPESPELPYVSELGLLQLAYVVVANTARVVSIRRGNPQAVGTFATDGLSQMDAAEVRTALTAPRAVAVAYTRHNVRINAVTHPIVGSDRVVVAEFAPFH